MCCDLAYVEPLPSKKILQPQEEQKKKQLGQTWYHEWIVFRLIAVFLLLQGRRLNRNLASSRNLEDKLFEIA